MTEQRYTVAVDVGESQIVAIAGYKDSAGSMKIDAVAKRRTEGLKAGRIENIAQINEALSGVIAQIETALNIEVQRAYGGLSGEFIRCEHHTESISISDPNNSVSHADVVTLNTLMRSVEAPASDIILESSPESYLVDGKREIKNPVGNFGQILSATFNFTLCDKDAYKRLNHAFIQAGIEMKQCFANSVAAAEAVLTPDEMEGGVAVVDLGEGVTNVAIYHRGSLRYMISIPIGGSSLNNDLRSLMIQERNIESIKVKHGCAIAQMADAGSISVAGRTPREKKSIPLYNIAVVIEERLSDIIIFVEREIRDAGYEGLLPYGVVLTGGGANMRFVDELFRRNMKVEVRVAAVTNGVDIASQQSVATPEFATVIGLLRRGIEIDIREGEERACTISIPDQTQPSLESPIEEEKEEEKKRVVMQPTQTELDLDEDEDEEEDLLEEDEQPKQRKKGGLLGFLSNKMNALFNSNDDPEL